MHLNVCRVLFTKAKTRGAAQVPINIDWIKKLHICVCVCVCVCVYYVYTHNCKIQAQSEEGRENH